MKAEQAPCSKQLGKGIKLRCCITIPTFWLKPLPEYSDWPLPWAAPNVLCASARWLFNTRKVPPQSGSLSLSAVLAEYFTQEACCSAPLWLMTSRLVEVHERNPLRTKWQRRIIMEL